MGAERIAITTGRFRHESRSGIETACPRALIRCSAAHVLIVTCAIAILCAPSAYANERVLADLDGDGVRDHVSLSRHDPTIVRVWLSSTRKIDVIRSREPILHIAAADLDGDAHAEIVARLPKSLRVWARRS